MSKSIEKILCLHCLEDLNRYKHIISELDRLGLSDKAYISEFTKLPINKVIGAQLTTLHTPYYNAFGKDVYGAVFSCMYNWLQLISWAYKKQYNNILCIEDDSTFKCTREEFNKYIDNIPSDADIVLFGFDFSIGYYLNFEQHYLSKCKNTDELFIKVDKDYKLTGAFGMYMNRKGMEYYLEYIQRKGCSSDLIWCNMKENMKHLNIYLPNKKLIESFPSKQSTILPNNWHSNKN